MKSEIKIDMQLIFLNIGKGYLLVDKRNRPLNPGLKTSKEILFKFYLLMEWH